MSTQINVQAETAQAVKGLQAVDAEMKKVGATAAQVSQQTAAVAPGQKIADEASPALKAADDLIAKFDAAEAAASATGAAGESGLGAMVPVLGAVAAGAVAVGGAVQTMQSIITAAADGGNADAQRLVTAFEGIGTAWDGVKQRLAATDTFRGLMSGLADVQKEINTTISGLGHLVTGFSDSASKYLEQQEVRKQAAVFSKVQANFDRVQRQENQTADAERIKSLDEVNAKIKENFDAQQSAVNKGVSNAQALGLYEEKQTALFRRRLQLLRQEQDDKDKAAEDERKRQEKERDEAGKTASEISRIRERYAAEDEKRSRSTRDKSLADELAQRRANAEKAGTLPQELAQQEDSLRDAATSAAEDAATKRQTALEKAGTKEFDQYDRIAREAQATADKLATAFEQAADRRIKAATRAADAERAAQQKRVDDLAKTDGVQDAAAGIRMKASDPRAIAARLAQNAVDAKTAEVGADGISPQEQKELDELKRATHRKAINQANGGFQAFSPEQVAGAIDQNAQAQVQALQSSGKASQDSVDALSQAVGVMQQFDSTQQMHSQQIQQLMQQMGVMGSNSARRAKTWGAKQVGG
jgi:hypothetical protein